MSHRTSRNAVQVAAFHRMIGALPWDGPVADMPAESIEVRNRLVEEECRELVEATRAGDVVAIADACADILYVVYGTAYTYGIPLDAVFDEVHASNLTKEPGPTGKVVKGAGYRPPNVAGVLAGTVPAPGERRYPADRPGWLSEYQEWPCGRCGREVDASEPHECMPGAPCDECGALAGAPGEVNWHHLTSCSLHPENVVV